MSDARRIRLSDLLAGAARLAPNALQMARCLPEVVEWRAHTHRSLGDLVGDTARRHPKRPAVWFRGDTWTWRRLDGLGNQLAHTLHARGVRCGDVVAVHSPNRPEVLALLIAVSRLSAVAALLNTAQRGAALSHSVSVSGAGFVVVDSTLKEAWPDTPHTDFDALLESAVDASDARPAAAGLVRRSDAAFYIYTSGTTGLPKASIMSHMRWLKAAQGYGHAMLRLRPTDVLYNALPLYHNLATTIAWGACVATGACFALSERFSASRFWTECRASGATAMSYIGELPRYLLAQSPHPGERDHNVRLATGVGLRNALWDDFKSRFGIERVAEFYGSSEGNTVFLNLFGLDHTVGFSPTPHVLVRWNADNDAPERDARGHLVKVKPGEPGLLLSKVTARYPYDGYTDESASRKKLIESPFGRGDTYVDSGDLLQKVGFGHAVFVDRVGDTFRWKGENVATAEVEAVLDRFEGIEESTVYGLSLDNTDGTPGMATLSVGPELDLDALYAHCRRDLPEYAVPVYLRLQRGLSITGTFKHQRAQLRRQGLAPDEQSTLFRRQADGPWAPIE